MITGRTMVNVKGMERVEKNSMMRKEHTRAIKKLMRRRKTKRKWRKKKEGIR